MRIYNDFEQWTAEWLKLRKGVITWTRLKALASKPSTATYKWLLDELIAEDFAPLPEVFQNDAMMRWNLLEPQAREEYEDMTWQKVDELWFCLHETKNYLGLSPDWLINYWTKKKPFYRKAIEIKCLWAKNHLKYIREDKVPAEHKWQVVNYFLVNEDLQELDFILYNPDVYVDKLRMHIIPVKREDYAKDIEEIQEKLKVFVDLWQEEIKKLTSKEDALPSNQ